VQRRDLNIEAAEDCAFAGDLAVAADVGEAAFDVDQAPEVSDLEIDG
jgi:hypothetical protein